MQLSIAVDYSARESILRTAHELQQHSLPKAQNFAAALMKVMNNKTRDVDLLIRTGGEQRLSDFLLWECAYAELFFTERMWPDFEATDLEEALLDYRQRERRYGRVPGHAVNS